MPGNCYGAIKYRIFDIEKKLDKIEEKIERLGDIEAKLDKLINTRNNTPDQNIADKNPPLFFSLKEPGKKITLDEAISELREIRLYNEQNQEEVE